jgi:carbonic anhydrase/acetyltransferase-like protein (isoleucine patch superfamily)
MTKSIKLSSDGNESIDDYVIFKYTYLSDLKEEFEKRNIIIGDNVHLKDSCIVDNNVLIGEDSIIFSCHIYENTEFGIDNKIFLNKGHLGEGLKTGDGVKILGDVYIGSNCVIEDYVEIYDKTKVGDNCQIGHNSKLLGFRCNIGDNVIIGVRAKIDRNVHINDGQLIEDDIEYSSIIFNGLMTSGQLVYWGTDEILLDMIVHKFDNKTQYVKYSLEEFRDVFESWPGDYISNAENDYFQKCYMLIEQMHKDEIMKPIKSLVMRRRNSDLEEFLSHEPPDSYIDYSENLDMKEKRIDDWMDGDPSNYWNID